MEESRIIRSAKQGDPQAIASFLGNHLASFSVWVTATPNRHYLDLYLEGLDPPHPDQILSLIQQLLVQLQPADVEVVKISGRKYGEIQAKWQQTFLLSAVQSSPSQLLDLGELEESLDLSEPIDLSDPEAEELVEINSLNALVLATHDALRLLGVVAKIDRILDTLKIELRSEQVPDREDCLLILYDVLSRLNLPDIHAVLVQGHTAQDVTPVWEESIPLDDLLISRQLLPDRQFISFQEEEDFWLPLGIGLAAGLLVFVVPLFNFAFGLAVTFIADVGQALGYGLMGYLPTGFKSPLEGGGVLATSWRSPLLFGAVYGLWGLLVFFLRRRFFWILGMVAIALLHGLVYLSSSLTELFINTSGHLMLWALASVLFYCALGGYACRHRGGRSLYMILSTFLMCYHLQLYGQMWQLPMAHSHWLAFVGIAITLLLPFLTYKIYRAQGLRVGLSQV